MADNITDLRRNYNDKINNAFQELIDRGDDVKPIFQQYAKYYREVLMPSVWTTRGAVMGKSWVGLSTRYAKWKLKHYGNRSANLTLIGRLKAAATGGEGHFARFEKDSMMIGIKGIPYASIHQTGGMAGRGLKSKIPQRPYILTSDNNLPIQASAKLEKLIQEHITKGLAEGAK